MTRARIGCLVLALNCASVGVEACAADPGDGPKGNDDGGSNDDGPAPLEAAGDADSDTSRDPGGDGADASLPGHDSADTGADDGSVAEEPPAPEASGAPDAPPDVAPCATCPLMVLYMTPTTTQTTNEIRPHFEIQNNGASAEDMTALTLRYWYTAQGSTSQAYDCDYAQIGCGSVNATFVAMSTPTATADHYFEVSFTGGSIASGTNSGEIQTRFHDASYAVTFDQTQDYSFDASDTAYTQSNQVTLYRNGALVWGVEP